MCTDIKKKAQLGNKILNPNSNNILYSILYIDKRFLNYFLICIALFLNLNMYIYIYMR